MAGNGSLPDRPSEYPQHPVPNLEGMNNDGHPTAPSAVPISEAAASASQYQELQGVPDVPGWKPEWVRFLKSRGQTTVFGDDSRFAYTLPEITDLMHTAFGPETHALTVNDLIDVWKIYIGPSLIKDGKGKSQMHQIDPSGGTNMPAGSTNGYYQSGNGPQHEAPNDYPGGIHRAAPPYDYSPVRNRQSRFYEDYSAHKSGASSSREGPRAGYGDPQLNSPRTNVQLPSLRSLDIWYLGRGYDPNQANLRTAE